MSDIRFNRWLHQSGTGGVSQDSSGNIGIGTTVPTMALDIRGDVNIGNTININNASGIISATTFTGTTGTFSGNVSAVDGTFTGNVTIGGTLTYEDVANIDAVGIITAQSDIIVGGGLTVAGISTFNNHVKLLDDDRLKFGIGEDLQIYHDSSNSSYIRDLGSGDLYLDTATGTNSAIRIMSGGNWANGAMAGFNQGGSVDLYYNNAKKFETTNTGAVVTGILTATTFSGNLTGNVTGDLTGNLAGTASIAGISSSISDTAVDVFVYDTRKDSDGGAWRKRTQHTSWYNETLGTATRGTRREFPAVAVIVTTATNVTIYDGDDPDLPMWMNFQSGSYYFIGPGNRVKNSAYMLNGILCVTKSGSVSWMSYISFVDDKARQYSDNDGEKRDYLVPISYRNANNANSVVNSIQKYTIINDATNDVAMTVLPNAPIDDATGLPIPTIAVATQGGTSIIRDDGSIIDITPYSDDYVAFDNNNLIIGRGDGSAIVYAGPIPKADISETTWRAQSDVTYFGAPTAANIDVYTSTYDPGNLTGVTKNAFSFDSSIGKVVKFDLNTADANSTMTAYAATSYNTGWMHGDIKGAFLSDTDATNVTGSELVTNGTFDTDTSNWTAVAGATLSVSSNRLVVTGDGSTAGGGAAQSFTTVNGKKYVLTYVAYAGSINVGQVRIGTSANAYDITFDNSVNSNAYDPIYFTAVGTTTFITFGVNAGVVTSDSFQYDNISVREVEEDRSVNNKGTAVYGTVTKSAVATGADLVAYSGFSASNYLQQPYNSDLLFGTDDFCITGWVNNTAPSNSVYEDIITFGNIGVVGYGSREPGNWLIQMNKEYGFNMYYRTSAGPEDSGWSNYSASGNFQKYSLNGLGIWYKITIVRSGDTIYSYANDDLLGSQPITGSFTTSSNLSDMKLTIGYEGGGSYGPYVALYSKLALWRISRSAPSPEQVKKMYEDEKVLFQENAKATLYGSSDAVTALGYDEDTELLHVGTSSGRSDFQGLRRINNTTTAVTTAISASDDLIAEQ